jgi:hydroxymethylpyrimidine/phosphomethylpyrimidine kinase
MPQTPPVVLTIAGFDPSSGAGITADIKTIAAHGCYGVACITAMTVQSTQGVSRVEALPPQLVSDTLRELSRDLEIAAIRIGMLGSAEVVAAVAEFLSSSKLGSVVLDPILRSSSGARLLESKGEGLLLERLLPLVTVITPNLEETASLSGLPVRNLQEMKAAALRLHELGAANVVVTGGHLEKAIDLLSFTHPNGGIETQVYKAERLRSRSTHGTGCAFASAVACHLAQGRQLPEAVLLAKAYVTAAITHAPPLGRGTGPLDHLYRMHESPRRAAPIVDPEPVS